jgi:predicted helicase
MVRSVEEVLKSEFGKSLSDEGVHILDPFTGTGNFITRIMQQIKKSRLPQKYAKELHCNEIMLLPYYIASMNIEHAYSEAISEYKPFEGICLVDTFDTTGQAGLFSTENTKRIKRQLAAEIRVVIGNPPYNVGQIDENDGNKNRAYRVDGGIDSRVAKTYTAASKATLRNKLSDPYVKAFRWATDRIKDHGIVCFITNNSFIDQIAFDGMRNHLARDYSSIYVLDLGGNVRKNPKLSGTTHNVFGIQVGVAITLLVRQHENDTQQAAKIFYGRMPENWRRTQKYDQLDAWATASKVDWQEVHPDERATWLTEGQQDDFQSLLALGDKVSKGNELTETLFRSFSLGIVSARDTYAYNSSQKTLEMIVKASIEAYNEALIKYQRLKSPRPPVEGIVNTNDPRIKWSHLTKIQLGRLEECEFDQRYVRESLYRPFYKQYYYFDGFWNERRYQLPRMFPVTESQIENCSIIVKNSGEWPFFVMASRMLNDYQPQGGSQCFPFYTYDEDGTNRQENITDWVLERFRAHYSDTNISKWNIFYYVYAVLHHPQYRDTYAANLKRELPRIPFTPDFWGFAEAGKQLAQLHVHYEEQEEYPLDMRETPGMPLNWRGEKMRLSKDKTQIVYNDFLTLAGIPPETFEYRLGNRSALDWVIDQYHVKTDKRSGIRVSKLAVVR